MAKAAIRFYANDGETVRRCVRAMEELGYERGTASMVFAEDDALALEKAENDAYRTTLLEGPANYLVDRDVDRAYADHLARGGAVADFSPSQASHRGGTGYGPPSGTGAG